MEAAEAREKAEQNHRQARYRLTMIQSHVRTKGRVNLDREQEARNGIEFIEAALKLFPDNAIYLNVYALLLGEGLGQKKLALEILDKASQLAPDDIQIKQNMRSLKAPAKGCLLVCFCIVPTVMFGYVFTKMCFGSY